MAYEVTATRRRPQRFGELAGQDFVAVTLKNAIETGKIAHAYLFSGPRGCGKTSAARILSRALNCEQGPTQEPCGVCSACQEIARGSCMDVIEIDGASNTSVNDIRQIKDEVLFPPNACRYKIYIIDEVHMLSTSAFNALLKTIEEPPPYVIFIFATTELHKVPATIKSRCQHFNFRLLSVDQIKELLAAAAAEIGLEAEDEALFWVAREATGSARDAYTLFDQVAAFSEGCLTMQKIQDKLAVTGVEQLNALAEACTAGDTAAALDLLDGMIQGGVSVEQLTGSIADYLRSLLLLQNGIRRESLLGYSAQRFSAAVLEKWNSLQLERGLSVFLQLYRDIRYSLDPRYELELAVSRLSHLTDYVSTAEVRQAIEEAKTLLGGNPHGFPHGSVPQRRDSRPFDYAGSGAGVGSTGSGGFSPVTPAAEKTTAGFSAVVSTAAFAPPEQPSGEKKTLPSHITFSVLKDRPPEKSAEEPAGSVQAVPVSPAPDERKSASGEAGSKGEVSTGDASFGDASKALSPFGTSHDLPPGELREKVIALLEESKPMAAAALAHTTDWSYTGNRVTALTEKPFQKKQLQQEAPLINEAIRRICGADLIFDIQLARQESVPSEELPVPVEVELLCRVFKGNII
ncbi:MAG: DNA polymerase III subunit gamma/tau [Spirochaetaceae bacterium]|jgi:DNA polymerase-3 subunit gamma/tau|nr:DNA polymerase III subunit gamma/tau [Spirochaetaceae bacterium]